MKAPKTMWPVGWPPPSTFTETWWRELKESLAQRGVDLDAPDSFSEAQWPEIKETFAERGVDLDALLTRRREIKESLTERGVDLDAETVDQPFGPAQVLHDAAQAGTGRRHRAMRPASDIASLRYAYSETQWREIKESLAERGVNLDVERVDDPCGPREWWGWDDYTPPQRPMFDALEELALYAKLAHGKRWLTPKQYAGKLQEEVIALEKALAMIDPTSVAPGLPTDDKLEARINRRHALRAAMTLEIAERRQYIAKLEAEGSSSKYNARTTYNGYWDELAKLWLKVTGNAGPKRRQHLRRFLIACTPPDLFPDMAAQELGQKLDSFINNFFKSR